MLAKQGIISRDDARAIAHGLDTILSEMETGKFRFKRALEDIHMNVESRLAELIGPSAGRLHTARSRNDQVATDFKLWVRDAIDDIDAALAGYQQRARREGAGACRDRHAGLHAPADRAAGDVRASSAGVCGDGGARSRPLRRCAQAPERKPARRGGARRHLLPARPRDDREGARLRPPGREFARRGVRPRLRDGSARRRLDHGGAPVALCRRDRAVVLAARRLRRALGQIHHRLIDHAAEAQSGRGRTGARQDRAHRRRARSAS